MPLLGNAALAMWWDMAPDMRAEFEHWHSHEHFPERLALPGFLRASRYTSLRGDDGIFVLYELVSHDTLGSAPYLASLNQPSEWSRKMMPHHRHMVRCQCHVLHSAGGSAARQALTLRFAPAPGQEGRCLAAVQALMADLAQQPGMAGVHLLRHQAPAIDTTTEQRIRGGDQVADCVLVACAYDGAALDEREHTQLSPAELQRLGAADGVVQGRYGLSWSATPGDVHPLDVHHPSPHHSP